MHTHDNEARPECIRLVTKIEEKLNTMQNTVDDQAELTRDLDRRVGVIEALQKTQFEILKDVTKQVGDILIKLTQLATHTEDFEQELYEYREKREQRETLISSQKTVRDTADTADAKNGLLKMFLTKYPLGSGMLIGMLVILMILVLVIVEAEAIRAAFTAIVKRLGGG